MTDSVAAFLHKRLTSDFHTSNKQHRKTYKQQQQKITTKGTPKHRK